MRKKTPPPPAQPDLFALPGDALDAAALQADLALWVEQGWLRALDQAFALFLHDHDPAAPASVLLAGALASLRLGSGHVCLDLPAALADDAWPARLPDTAPPGAHAPADWLRNLRLDDWQRALRASRLCADGPGGTPLVLRGPRLYLRRYWQYEQDVRAGIAARLAHAPVAPAAAVRPVLQALFQPFGGPAAAPAGDGARPDWQQLACALALRQRFAIVTGGPGTGKTTTVVRLLALLQSMAQAAQGRPLRIRLAAPTGKAAARLTESIRGALDHLPWDRLPGGAALREAVPAAATTLHRLLGSRPDSRHFRHHAGHPLPLDVLVVDEASMVDLELMAQLLQALPPDARLVLLGDKDQLASVEAGAVLGELCSRAQDGHYDAATVQWLQDCTGQRPPPALCDAAGQPLDQAIAMLRESRRFTAGSGIGRLAEAVNQGDARAALALARQGLPDVRRCRLAGPPGAGDPALRALLLADGAPPGPAPVLRAMHATRPAAGAPRPQWDAWAAALLAASTRFQLLCALRDGPWGVAGLNEAVAGLLHQQGLIAATQGWYAGRPVLVTRNDHALGLMNGDVGLTLELPVFDGDGRVPDPAAPPVRRVAFAAGDGSGGVRWVLPARLQAVETVFAMTVHKSQGSEFEHAALVLPDQGSPVLTRELVYTGITRARAWFTLVGGEAALGPVLAGAIGRRVQRASGLMAGD
ncbi:exodeoxyribonuclease V subunit alpha [Pseudorhodoferax sp.]|uniref:exodeoxyribonuclease V subunit alpha n=1 Tax=Pseudorhodoferax sp. TaxID=1993553 RepID=UPI0039E30013